MTKRPTPPRSSVFLRPRIITFCSRWQGGPPVGFVSGGELTHPDKGTEMFLYELGVDERHRRLGIASELVAALRDMARKRSCYDMWVLTDHDNDAAHTAFVHKNMVSGVFNV